MWNPCGGIHSGGEVQLGEVHANLFEALDVYRFPMEQLVPGAQLLRVQETSRDHFLAKQLFLVVRLMLGDLLGAEDV